MSDKTTRPPKDNLVRAVFPGPEVRSEPDDDFIGHLTGHLAVWDQWTEINSSWEGNFLESVRSSAFDKAVSENTPKVLLNHGQDPQVGDKPLGPPLRLAPDDIGMAYDVGLIDTSYNRDILPGLKQKLYGSSFRFSVIKEEFKRDAKKSAHNPKGLPERTILEATLPEFGPVTFPAYIGADAGARMEMRSMTDEFILTEALDQFIEEPEKLRALLAQRGIQQPERADALPTDGAASEHSDEGSRSEPEAQPDPPPAVAATTPQDPPKSGSLSVRETPIVNTIEERQSRLDEISARLTEINADHGVDVLPEAIQSEWDLLTEERSTHQKAIDAYESRMAVLESAAAKPQNVERVAQRTSRTSATSRVPANIYDLTEYRALSSSPEQERNALKDGAKRAIEIATFGHEAADENKNKIELDKLLSQDESGDFARHILGTGNPVYVRAIAKKFAGKFLTTEEERAIATVGTTTTGGYNVPFTLDPTLILTSDGSVNPLRQMARVERLTQGNTWKGVTTAGVTITRGPAELQPVTPTEVTFGQPEVTVQPVKVEIQYSIEADEDWPRLQTELARILQEAKDDEEAESFVNGVGTTVYPEGVAAGLATSSDVGTTGDGLDVADLYRLEGALPPKYRARAQFLANKAIYSQIRQFSVGTTGEGSVWTRGIAVGDPAQLLGYPAREISTMESDPTADGERVMLFGDFRAGFIIVDKVGMTIEIDPHVRDGNGKWIGARAMLAHYRNSSLVLNDNALRALVIGVVTS
jgi:HK97 family phage major capsid protein/HK97 family phage prohead protease